jgi:serine/threonine-protein kinase
MMRLFIEQVVQRALYPGFLAGREPRSDNPHNHPLSRTLARVHDNLEAELHVALAEGILGRDEVDALVAEARRLRQSPLDLLGERGRISADTIASLRRRTPDAEARDPDETLTVSPDKRSRDDAPVFPIPGWDRYQCIRFLGQGGMGKVFLARDPRLHRDVAIKLVRGDAPDAIKRLVAEARAQARVSHERVCKVYEVGEVGGEVYIAMQHIDGASLGALAPQLNVEQAAMIVREAALGVHEAHRVGILHRDLKPSNILVEQAEDGAYRPFVMDFGLARSITAEGSTETGSVLGTPYYMAPEQARGEVSRLDRRADVYSLGASLYHVLTGVPPIQGSNGLEVLSNIATMEPVAPRAVAPDIPVDLEAIVVKCLEKDRSARYDSARALADDLESFLRGDPVAARRAGLAYRLRKRLQKHRRLVAAAGVSLGVVIVALGWGIKTRGEAAGRERLARRFTEQVEHIEASARYSALSPLHDTTRDRREIRASMDELDAEMKNGGEIAVGPGSYALGRGYLALGDDEKAKEYLEMGWTHGFQEPRAAYALALVTGHLYQEKLREAERIEQKELREAKKREIELRYRDPALAYLAQSAGAKVPSKAYVAALVAFYEDRLDEALGHLDAIGDGLPWFYEAPELRGEILEARASRRWNAGDREGAHADFEAGRRAHARAAVVGESVPAVHVAAADLEFGAMLMELYSAGDVDPAFDRGVADVERALVVDPSDLPALLLDARFHRRMAEHRGNQGASGDDMIQKAISAAERAIAAAPDNAAGRTELAVAHWQSGQLRSERGLDPGEPLQKAAALFEAFRAEDRDYDYHVDVGLVFDTWADYQEQTGTDPMPNRARSIEAYRAATALDERRSFAWLNLGNAYRLRAEHPQCKDPDGDLGRSIPALEKALAANPEHAVAHYYAGEAYSLAAHRATERGGAAGPDLARALEHYRKGLSINPKHPYLRNGLGIALLDQAREAWDRGADPAPSIEEARAAFEQLAAIAPDKDLGIMNLGEALTQAVGYQRARGEDPRPAAALAVASLQRAIEKFPDAGAPRANLGKVYALLAAYEFDRGRDPEKALSRAFPELSEALKQNPEDGQSHRFLGEARATQALNRARRARGAAADLDEAAGELRRAIEAAPGDQDTRIAFGHFCRARADVDSRAGRDPGPALQRGLAGVEEVLKARPGWADARLLRGSLLLAEAESLAAEARRARAGQALADFEAALATNPNLAPRWKGLGAVARRLAAP